MAEGGVIEEGIELQSLEASEDLGSPLHKAINDSRTALHLAIQSQNMTLVCKLLGSFPKEMSLELLVAKDQNESTPLHLAVQGGKRKQLLAILLKDMSVEDCHEALSQTNKAGETVMHLVTAHCKLGLIRQVLELIPRKDLRAIMLTTVDSKRRTPLHGCGRDNSCLRFLLDSVDIIKRLKIIQLWKGIKSILLNVLEITPEEAKFLTKWSDERGNNFLHLVAEQDHMKSAELYLSLLEECDINKALVQRNKKNRTPYNLAKKGSMKALLTWAEKEKGFYLLTTPPVVLIMYQTEDRDGAEDEWRSLSESLPDFQVEPIVRPDLTADEMLGAIREAANNTEDISSLIVFIMAHGAKGLVWGKGDTPLRIQDILLTMNDPCLNGKPKVLLIQACQGRNDHRQFSVQLADQKTTHKSGTKRSDGPVPGNARRGVQAQIASPGLVTPSLKHDLHTIMNAFCENATGDSGVPPLTGEVLAELVSTTASEEDRSRADEAGNKLMRALHEYVMSQQSGDSVGQVLSQHEIETYNIQHRDTVTIIATVTGGIAERNEMVPIFARLLKNSTNNQCISEIFPKMHDELKGKVSDQIPEFRSTLTKKLCLRKIFQPTRSKRFRTGPLLLKCISPHTAK